MGARNSGEFEKGDFFRSCVCLAVNNVNKDGLVRVGLSFCFLWPIVVDDFV